MRTFPLALIIAVPAVIGSAPAVHAAVTSCAGSLSGNLNGDIVVGTGASCTLSNATVTGSVQVQQNASLVVDATAQPTTSAAMSRPLTARPRFSKAASQ